MKRFLWLCALPLAVWGYDNLTVSGTWSLKKAVEKPAGAALLPDGRAVFADGAQGRLAVFSVKGKPEGVWGRRGTGPGQLSEPAGLAADAAGRLFVADRGNHRVQIFENGKALGAFGGKGRGPGQFFSPEAVAVSWDGFLFVADSGNRRIQVFNRDGVFLHSFAGEGEHRLDSPRALAVTPQNRLYVLDGARRKVLIFSPGGKSLGILATQGEDPAALAADEFGNLYVADRMGRKIQEFDPEGRPQGSFGGQGSGPGQFKTITLLAAGPGGLLAAVDPSLSRVQVFTVQSTGRGPLSSRPTLRFSVRSRKVLDVSADALAFAGSRLWTLDRKNARLTAFDDYGQSAPRVSPSPERSADAFKEPAALAAAGGLLFVADPGRRCVWVRGADGAASSGRIEGAGKGDGPFKGPTGVAVDSFGRVIVADPALGRCQVFSQDGVYFMGLGIPGTGPQRLSQPAAVAVTDAEIAVLDTGRQAVLGFDFKGQALWEIKSGLSEPIALAAGPRGLLYVLERRAGRVSLFRKGRRLGSFGSPEQFPSPRAVAVDDRGVVWVADGGRVLPFEAVLAPAAVEKLAARGTEGRVTLSWSADDDPPSLGYELFRSTDGAPRDAAVLASTASVHVDDHVIPGLTYDYTLVPVGRDLAGARLAGAATTVRIKTARPANLPPVQIQPLQIEPVFSAQYKRYAVHPLGRTMIKNNTEKTFLQVKVGFQLLEFMDNPTETDLDRLEPGAREGVDLKAVFNNRILSLTEDTPVQAKVTVTYYEDGVEKRIERVQAFKVFSRNAMSWDDPRRLATFITPKDPPLLEFTRAVVRDFAPELAATPVPKPLAQAALVFSALGAGGLSYLQDPVSPHAKTAETLGAVDYVQYPRETLARKTGDCDDLVNLAAAALETLAIPTAVVDVPGHVFLLFQLEAVPSGFPGFPEDLLVERDGEWWVPIEVTRVGRPFDQAWREGARAYRQAGEKARVFEVSEAWTAYPPATLPDTTGAAPPTREAIETKFPGVLEGLAALRFETLSGDLLAAQKKDPSAIEPALQLGLLHAEYGQWAAAREWFNKVLAQVPAHAAALNNCGNIHLLLGEPALAVPFYEKAVETDPKDPGVWMNLARASWRAGDREKARRSFDRAVQESPALTGSIGSFDDFTGALDAAKTPSP